MTGSTSPSSRNFALTEGGPTYRIETKIGLVRQNSPKILRRALLSILLTWVPLFVLSALQHIAIGHRVPVPFLGDFAVHARFLLAVPLLLVAEIVVGPHLAHAARHFVDSGLVTPDDYDNFEEAIDDGLKGRDSTIAELILVLLAYGLTATSQVFLSMNVSTWYIVRTNEGISLTWAGWWFILFCVPLFQFLTLRWLWRQFLWAQFLWRMSKLKLQLMPTHPDEAGGLGFVGESQRFFGILLFAYSVATSGVLANQVIYGHAPLQHFAPSIVAYVVIFVGIVIAPLTVFTGMLLRTKRSGLYKYGTLATTYTTSFHKKWIVASSPAEEPLLGSGDIQSLADLGNSFGFIEKMDALPMGPRTPIHLALACLLPMAPLILTMMPLSEVLKILLKFVA
jgi:hypothetical protein